MIKTHTGALLSTVKKHKLVSTSELYRIAEECGNIRDMSARLEHKVQELQKLGLVLYFSNIQEPLKDTDKVMIGTRLNKQKGLAERRTAFKSIW